MSFKRAITRALNPVEKHSERIDIKLREVHNWESLKFSVIVSAFNKFDTSNSSISVNVFGYEKLIYPLRISEHNYKRESTVNLFLISDDTKQHYCWLKDIGKLYLYKHQHIAMLDMCAFDVLILSIARNH